MDGITEQSDPPSDQQSPSRIWHFDRNVSIQKLRIFLKTSVEGVSTTAELCQHIGSLQESPDVVDVHWEENSVCSDSDLKALGNAMNGLQGFVELLIRGAWTDEKASIFLRHVGTSLRGLVIEFGRQLRIPSILGETQGFSFLRSLRLWSVKLDEDYCGSLEQVLHGHRQDFEIEFYSCSFPSFKGYFVVADAAINTGCFLYISCYGTSLRDASIPDDASDSSTINRESHHTFYNIYERNKDWRRKELKEKDLENHCFAVAAGQHMNRYNHLNRAGRLKLLSNEQKPTVRECVDVLCQDTVHNCVDYIFHFIKMNPDVYAAAAVQKD